MACGLVLAGLAILAAAEPTLAGAGDSPTGERPPNVVVFLVDDLGWRDTSAYGSTFYETPNVERLARRGMRFTNAYAANPLCSPTRASFLTGQYPCRLGITTPAGHIREEVLKATLPERGPPRQKVLTPRTANRLPLEAVTLAEALKGSGYATAHFGKWHLGWEPYHPQAQGFDLAMPGGSYPGPPGTYFSPFRAPIFPGAPPGRHIDDLCTDAAIAWLQSHKGEPFYLNYWMFSVHAPYDGDRPELRAKYARKADPRSPQRNPVMGAMIETMDACVGRVLDAIDDLGIAGNTVILFTGDNGGVSWQEVEGAPVTSNLPLRNGKASIYEGGTRENLIVAWPGHVRPASTSDALVSSIDHYPTLLEAAGVERPEGHQVDGLSYLGVLTETSSLQREALFCHFPHDIPASGNRPSTWVRQGDWKLIRFYCDGPDRADRFELYNLTLDPGEARDLAASEPARVRALSGLIDRHLADTGALVPRPNPAYEEGQETGAWVAQGDATAARDGEALVITSGGPDPYVVVRNLPAGRAPFRLRFRYQSSGRGEGRIYWSGRPQGVFRKEDSAAFAMVHDGGWHDVEVVPASTAAIRALRIDPGTAPGVIRIEELRFQDARGRAIAGGAGGPTAR